MANPPWWRQPVCRNQGRNVITAACGYELVALWSGRLPTISEIIDRPRLIWRIPGWALAAVLLGLLGHHWLVEV